MKNAQLSDLLVLDTSTFADAMHCIEDSGQGICFVVDKKQHFIGIITDGDIRRYILDGEQLETPVVQIANKNAITMSYGAEDEEILTMLGSRINHIPLLDETGKIVDYANLSRSHQIPVLEPVFKGNEEIYLNECIKTGWISSQGKFVTEFEDAFAKFIGADKACTTSNGTTALHLALLSLGIGEGDEVLVPNLTFGASVNSIIHCGAIPVFIDSDSENWTIDVTKIEPAITDRTKAIMPVHLFGHPCDMDEICRIAKKFNLLIVEDCAESIGAKYKGKMTGTFGDAAAFSFFGNKIITCGEGGMIVFKNKTDHDTALVLRDHGMSKERRYWHEKVGYNYRMTNLQAAIGLAQIEEISNILRMRKVIGHTYDRVFKNSPEIITQKTEPWATHCYWLYSITLSGSVNISRDKLISRLKLKGIETRPVFFPMDQMPAFEKYNNSNPLEISHAISDNGISLPSSSSLEEADIVYIAETVLDTIAKETNRTILAQSGRTASASKGKMNLVSQ